MQVSPLVVTPVAGSVYQNPWPSIMGHAVVNERAVSMVDWHVEDRDDNELVRALPELQRPQSQWLRNSASGLWTSARVWRADRKPEDLDAKDLAVSVDDHVRALVPEGAHVDTQFEQGQVATRLSVTVYKHGRPDAAGTLAEVCGL
jgi:hypothetical protein